MKPRPHARLRSESLSATHCGVAVQKWVREREREKETGKRQRETVEEQEIESARETENKRLKD